MTDPFSRWTLDDLKQLVSENPLAWIVPLADPVQAMEMPVLMQDDVAAGKCMLTGHLPRRLPLVKTLQHDPRALFLFKGPDAYISPGWVTQPKWGATWNFVDARVQADVRLNEDFTDKSLRDLAGHMERGRVSPWSIDELEERLPVLMQHIVGFQAEMTHSEMRLKLGQDESEQSFAEILDALGGHPLAGWMRQAQCVAGVE